MPVDSVGNTLATAKPIFPIASAQTLTEFIGVDAGTLDANDYYSFKLARTSSVTLSLTGLSANANIEIRTSADAIATDVNGSLLSSVNTGTLTESINGILDPGTYYIRVSPGPATDPLNPTSTTPSTNYTLNVAANSNTKTDILWRNYQTGSNDIWVMDGTTRVSGVNLPSVGDINWNIQATGDFNSDGNTDIVWRNYQTGENVFWLMNGTTLVSSLFFTPLADLNWQIQGAGDFNGDASTDLVWRNYQTGENVVWFINNVTLSSRTFIEANPTLTARIQGVADFNQDGNPDIIWRDYSANPNNNFIWLMNGITKASVALLPALADLNWNIQGTVDLNDDGNSDLLWRNLNTGENVVWFLKGTTFSSGAFLVPVADLNWRATPPFNRLLPAVRADAVGNSTATAFSIGPANGNGTYRDAVGSTDADDYYQFSIGSVTRLNLALTGAGGGALDSSSNLDLRLRNASGTVVASSTNAGNASEGITLAGLAAGTYYIQVAATAGSSAYSLNLSANNLPVLVSNNALTLSEGSALTISNTLLRVTDENNTPAQLTYTLVTPPDSARGNLRLNGAAIAQSSIFTQADIDAGRLSYSQNGSETLSDSFVFSVSDGIDGAIGNTTFTINTVPVNDLPVLVTKQALTLSEGATANLSSLSLLVTDVEQTAAQLIYSLNSSPTNGSLLLNGTAIAAGSTFTQADVSSGTRLSYSHNGSETTNDSFSFTVTDGAGGTVPLSPQTFSLSITPVNDAPVLISNQGLTVAEGAAVTITASLLQTSDAEFTGPAISPQLPDRIVYTVGTAPINGTLFVGTTALTANGTFTQADINNNRVLYNHNGGETNSDSFVFRVSDGTTVTTDSTFNIVVSSVNSPPVLNLNAGLTLNEGTTASIGSTLLQVTDPDNSPPQVRYTLGLEPVNGDLKLNGTALVTGQTFTQQDINTLNRLTYQHDGSETTSDSFSFTASDPSGAAISSTTFSIAVAPVNDAPTLLSNVGLTLSEGTASNITTTLLSATDVDNLDAQITYTVSTPPARGSLLLGTTTVTSFTQAELAGGQLRYVHAGSESIADSFSFTLSDGVATVAARTFNVSVLPVNDLPGIASNLGLTLAEGATSTIGSGLLSVTDNDGPGPLTYTVGTGTTRGTLKLGTATLVAGQTFTQANLVGNLLSYTHDGSETTADSFTFTVSDGATGVLALTTFNIAVTPANDAPVLVSNGGITLLEGALTTISSSLLQVSDGDNPPSNSLVYSVVTPPTNGTLLLGGSTATSFTQANLNSGQLVYQHSGNESISDSFTFNVTDGVVTTPIGPSLFNITVTPVNDAPGIASNLGLTLAEGATSTIGSSLLTITDNDGPGPLAYTVGTGTTRGTLKLGTATLVAGQTFTQANIADNSLSYTHDGSETLTDNFTFTATDGSTGTIALTTFSINVTPVNDAPVLNVPGFQSINEDLPLAFTGVNRISVSDADIGSNLLVVTLSASGGTLSLNPGSLTVTGSSPSPITLTGQLTAVNNALSSLVYRGLANFNGPDAISISVTDQGSTGAGGAKTDTRTIDLIVNPINDAPILTVPGAQTILEDESLLIGLIDTTDTDSGTNPVRVSLTAANGVLTLGDTGGLSFADAAANGSSTITATGTIDSVRTALATLSYQGNANYFGADAIVINVDDQGAVGAPGALSIQRTISVGVIPVNDAPSFTAGPNLVVNEDAAAQTVNWATGIATGPANEASQTLNFVTSNDNPNLFATAPTIDPSGRLTYTLAPNANGVATVTVNLQDNGGVADGGSNTSPPSVFTITANPVNDAPSFTKGANQTIAEDEGVQTIAGWATAISAGPADEATQALTFLVNTDNPSLFSVAPTIDPAGTLTYTAAPNANGTAIVTVQLKDNGGTALGGVDSSALQTFTINVTALNDAPVFTLPNAPTVREDTTLPIAGISLTDVDAGSSPLVVTLSVANGTLRLGNSAGLTITGDNTSSVAVTGNLSDINAALAGISYRGNLNFNGSDALVLNASDQGAAGSGAIGIDNRTLGINVTAVNDAPVVTVPASQTIDEDTDLPLSGISIADVDASSGQVRVTLSAVNGILTLPSSVGSSTLTITDTVDAINTAIANLIYRGKPNYNGADTITITTNDQGNTGFGGSLNDTKTISVTVNAVNDVPILTVPAAQTVNEDTNLVFNAGRAIALTDVDSGANPIQVSFTVSNGNLTLSEVSGSTLTGNGTGAITYSGTLAALTPVLNTLTYRGRQDFFGTDTLNVTVNDQGNTGSGSPGTVTGSVAITVSSINDAPVLGTNRGLTLSESTSSVITNAQLRTTDTDNTPAQLVYTLFSAVTSGSLRLAGSTTPTLVTGSTFTQADVDNGFLSYLQNGSETTSDSFTFRVSDNTSGSITVPGTGNATFNILIDPVNDAPVIVNNVRLNLTEGGNSTISNTLLSASDADNTPTQVRYTLSSSPTNGSIELNGAPLAVNQSFTQADIDGNRISYRHNGSETTSDSFIFAVSDGVGGTTGNRTFNVGITNVNDAPTLVSAGPATVNEGATLSITNTLLRTSDSDNLTSELIYTLPTVPIAGTLFLNSTALVGGATVTQQQIDQGALTYVHNGSEPTGNDAFFFRVSDGTTTLPDRIFNININPVNDPPVLVNNTGLLLSGNAPSRTVIATSRLQVTDIDNAPAQLTYTLTAVPNQTVGVLQLNGAPLAAGGTFTQADIDSGRLSFDYFGNGISENIRFTVSDGAAGGTLSNASFNIRFSYS